MRNKFLAMGLVVLAGGVVLGAVAGQVSAQGWQGGTGRGYGQGTGVEANADVANHGAFGAGSLERGNGYANGGLGQPGVGSTGTCALCNGVVDGTLTDVEVAALTDVLEEEHTAKALYEQAIADLGNVRPFSRIVVSEQRHIDAIERLFTRYGVAIPDVKIELDVHFDTLAEAAAAGVKAEKEDAALYDEWLPKVENAEVIRVFKSLQSASLNQHLPALENYAQ